MSGGASARVKSKVYSSRTRHIQLTTDSFYQVRRGFIKAARARAAAQRRLDGVAEKKGPMGLLRMMTSKTVDKTGMREAKEEKDAEIEKALTARLGEAVDDGSGSTSASPSAAEQRLTLPPLEGGQATDANQDNVGENKEGINNNSSTGRVGARGHPQQGATTTVRLDSNTEDRLARIEALLVDATSQLVAVQRAALLGQARGGEGGEGGRDGGGDGDGEGGGASDGAGMGAGPQ